MSGAYPVARNPLQTIACVLRGKSNHTGGGRHRIDLCTLVFPLLPINLFSLLIFCSLLFALIFCLQIPISIFSLLRIPFLLLFSP